MPRSRSINAGVCYLRMDEVNLSIYSTRGMFFAHTYNRVCLFSTHVNVDFRIKDMHPNKPNNQTYALEFVIWYKKAINCFMA